jgi:5-methylcytosine-specific restriction endonuclease McrA
MRICKKCGEEKPLSEYYKASPDRDWYRGTCKTCSLAEMKARREANVEDARRKDRERYTGERKAKQLATARAHYRETRERQLALKKIYYESNREAWTTYRAKRKAAKCSVEHQPYTRREIYDRDGGKCRLCSKKLAYGPGEFQIDHIVPISLGGPDTPTNVQLTCGPCNREKWATLEGQLYFAA